LHIKYWNNTNFIYHFRNNTNSNYRKHVISSILIFNFTLSFIFVVAKCLISKQ
jgi:hypothetical protein